ncbi:hypothetical protein TD95_004173 [Thielaviopsis punctulata]|uniref:AAA+ ATPase domain-containing protein n=1 Tax=Thielaviopsis punctulata TaxID=72032 RepID=A0A0F4ZHN9_9PEZI|nr:hypothetical protein TD95_004173 [Thielaviopsis punctulata]
MLEHSTPGYATLHAFFARWLHIDITKLAMVLTICGLLSGVISDVKNAATRFYWWAARFLTASISIAANDRLNREVINWLGAHVLKPRNRSPSFGNGSATRTLTARSSDVDAVQQDAFLFTRPVERNDTAMHIDKRPPVQYLPTFNTVWFTFERKLFLVRRVTDGAGASNPDASRPGSRAGMWSYEYNDAIGNDPLVVMCLGRSVAPVKRFLGACRDFADKQAEKYVTVRVSKGNWHIQAWDTTILRPRRSLDSVHFDRRAKQDLIRDITTYLNPATSRFYTNRGIPYRRGYLLHGPPGTGKTSLSLALAAHFNLDLHLIHLPSVKEDAKLDRLFVTLPPRCLVLLEDIDCVGIKRRTSTHMSSRWSAELGDEVFSSDDEDDALTQHGLPMANSLTLSGLLNVLDGVTSQEGRIVLMTSNAPDSLDEALMRPGRVDKKVFLGNLSRDCAEEMFIRVYGESRDAYSEPEDHFSDSASITTSTNPFASKSTITPSSDYLPYSRPHCDRDTLQRLALQFAQQIPNELFSPASVQGFLLEHKDSPYEALSYLDAWVVAEQQRIEEAAHAKERVQERRNKKRDNERLKRKIESLQQENSLKQSIKATLEEKARLQMEEMAVLKKQPVVEAKIETRSHIQTSEQRETKASTQDQPQKSDRESTISDKDSQKSSKKHRSKDKKKTKYLSATVEDESDHSSKSSFTSSSASSSSRASSRRSISPRDVLSAVTSPEPEHSPIPTTNIEAIKARLQRASSVQSAGQPVPINTTVPKLADIVPKKLVLSAAIETEQVPKPADRHIPEQRAEEPKQPAKPHVQAPEHQTLPTPLQVPPNYMRTETPGEPAHEGSVHAHDDRRHEQVHDDVDRGQNATQVKERLDKIEEEPEQPRDDPVAASVSAAPAPPLVPPKRAGTPIPAAMTPPPPRLHTPKTISPLPSPPVSTPSSAAPSLSHATASVGVSAVTAGLHGSFSTTSASSNNSNTLYAPRPNSRSNSRPNSLIEGDDSASNNSVAATPQFAPLSVAHKTQAANMLSRMPLFRRRSSQSGLGVESGKQPRRLPDVVSAAVEAHNNMVGSSANGSVYLGGGGSPSSGSSMARSMTSSRRSSNGSTALSIPDSGASRSDLTPTPTVSGETAASPHERVQPHLHSESGVAVSKFGKEIK